MSPILLWQTDVTLSTLKEAEGDCRWMLFCAFHTRAIQSMTLDSVWSHLLTPNWLLLCQTCRGCWSIKKQQQKNPERRFDLARLCSEEEGERGRGVHRQQGDGHRLIITQHTSHSRSVLLSAAKSSPFVENAATYCEDIWKWGEGVKWFNKYGTYTHISGERVGCGLIAKLTQTPVWFGCSDYLT